MDKCIKCGGPTEDDYALCPQCHSEEVMLMIEEERREPPEDET